MLHPQFAGTGKVIAKGLAASPGAAVGKVYFTADDAEAAAERGEKVILVRSETSPEDVHGMMVAEGILTARGGLVSHAAVVARGWGTPAVVGAEAVADLRASRSRPTASPSTRATSSRSTARPARSCSARWRWPPPSRRRSSTSILGWADTVRARASSACAPTPTPARTPPTPASSAPRASGCAAPSTCSSPPTGCRSCARMILADTAEEEAAALEELRKVQQDDFTEILEAMDGLPVTVRLLDPPLHEFLPSVEELRIKQATSGLDDEEKALLAPPRAGPSTTR